MQFQVVYRVSVPMVGMCRAMQNGPFSPTMWEIKVSMYAIITAPTLPKHWHPPQGGMQVAIIILVLQVIHLIVTMQPISVRCLRDTTLALITIIVNYPVSGVPQDKVFPIHFIATYTTTEAMSVVVWNPIPTVIQSVACVMRAHQRIFHQ